MGGRQGADLKKRTDELKRTLRKDYKHKVILERGSKHTRVLRKSDRKQITVISDTPSSYRSLKHLLNDLRKANVFKNAPPQLQMTSLTMEWEDRERGLGVLQHLGWKPGQIGRGGGGLRRFGELVQEATLQAKLDDKPLRRDAYTHPIRVAIIEGGDVAPETLDKLLVGIEYAEDKLTDGEPTLYNPPGEEPPPKVEPEAVEVVHEDVPAPEPVYEEVGPLYSDNGKVNADSLHLRILAAILDPNVSREEALQLAVEVAGLESH
jgi:hypothetical protein